MARRSLAVAWALAVPALARPATLDAAEAGGPLTPVADVPLPGGPTRFDYQAVDEAHGHLVVAHLGDDAVLVLRLADGGLVKRLTGIPRPRGVATGAGRIFVTSAPDRLVVVDAATLEVVARVATGGAPDGVAWDPAHQVVAVSDQGDGAVSLLAGAGGGARRQVRLGPETGNVVHDAARGRFWVTVAGTRPADVLVSLDPVSGATGARFDLPGCRGAHGLSLHPDGRSALVACEVNGALLRVDLATGALVAARAGGRPDVLAVDPGRGWLYVAAEHGDLAIFDLWEPGLALVGRQRVGEAAHTVAVDPASHRVFLPLQAGPGGRPLLRIMRPAGR